MSGGRFCEPDNNDDCNKCTRQIYSTTVDQCHALCLLQASYPRCKRKKASNINYCKQHERKRIDSRRSYKRSGLLFLNPDDGPTLLYRQLDFIRRQGQNPFDDYKDEHKFEILKLLKFDLESLIMKRKEHTYHFYNFIEGDTHNNFLRPMQCMLSLAQQIIHRQQSIRNSQHVEASISSGDTLRNKFEFLEIEHDYSISTNLSADKDDKVAKVLSEDSSCTSSSLEPDTTTTNNNNNNNNNIIDQTEEELLSEFNPLLANEIVSSVLFLRANDYIFTLNDQLVTVLASFCLSSMQQSFSVQLVAARRLIQNEEVYEKAVQMWLSNCSDLQMQYAMSWIFCNEYVTYNPSARIRIPLGIEDYKVPESHFVQVLTMLRQIILELLLVGLKNTFQPKRDLAFTDMNILRQTFTETMQQFNPHFKISRMVNLVISYLETTTKADVVYMCSMINKSSTLIQRTQFPHLDSSVPTVADVYASHSVVFRGAMDIMGQILRLMQVYASESLIKRQLLTASVKRGNGFQDMKEQDQQQQQSRKQKKKKRLQILELTSYDYRDADLKYLDIKYQPSVVSLMHEIDTTLQRGLAFNLPVIDILLRSVHKLFTDKKISFSEYDVWICVNKTVSLTFSARFASRLGMVEFDRYVPWPQFVKNDNVMIGNLKDIIWQILHQYASAWEIQSTFLDVKSTALTELRNSMNQGQIVYTILNLTKLPELNGIHGAWNRLYSEDGTRKQLQLIGKYDFVISKKIVLIKPDNLIWAFYENF